MTLKVQVVSFPVAINFGGRACVFFCLSVQIMQGKVEWQLDSESEGKIKRDIQYIDNDIKLDLGNIEIQLSRMGKVLQWVD